MEIKLFVGIDLAALPKNPTGVAAYDGRFEPSTLYGDGEIVDFVSGRCPGTVAVDAPLSMPYGRCCFNDGCCGPRKMRVCDRMMIGMGHRVFPPGFSFMKQLTMRGMALKGVLEAVGFKVIEVHPRTSMRILGIEGFSQAKNEHEADACAAAMTAYLFDEGKCREIAGPDGAIVIPL
jgi:predicted nuclease with RNAse H fold